MASPLQPTSPRAPPTAPTAPAVDPRATAKTTPSTAVDSFQAPKASAPVVLDPPVTPTQEIAKAPAEALTLGREVPVIGQFAPAGATESYSNALYNCGPAVMAMAARGAGPDARFIDSAGEAHLVAETTDAALVSEFARIGGTTERNGTSFKGMRDIAHAIGLDVDRSEAVWANQGEGARIDSAWIDSALKTGKLVAVNGAFTPAHDKEARVDHFLLITGKNARGAYVVNDSWDGKRKTMSAEALRTFLIDNTVHDGLAIVIG